MAERESEEQVARSPAEGSDRGEPGDPQPTDDPGDTNEGADDRARVVEPGSGESSPRAS